MNDRPERLAWLDTVQSHIRARTISPPAAHVAHTLATHYINGNNEAWPSQAELVAATGWSTRTIRRALHDLETTGLLEIKRGRHVSVYKLRHSATRAE